MRLITPYPKLSHDEKKSTKLTTKEIIEIQAEFSKNPNYKIFADYYNVAQVTIRYWIDEEYRKKQNKRRGGYTQKQYRDYINNIKKNNPERWKQIMRSYHSSSKKVVEQTKEYERAYYHKTRKYNKIHKNQVREYYFKNKEKMKAYHKKYVSENKEKIKLYMQQYRKNHRRN